jgi:hypothetical protein
VIIVGIKEITIQEICDLRYCKNKTAEELIILMILELVILILSLMMRMNHTVYSDSAINMQRVIS